MKDINVNKKVPLFVGSELPLFLFELEIADEIELKNCHNDIEIIYANKGDGEVFYDFEYIPIKEHEFCIINKNTMHSARSNTLLNFTNIGINDNFFEIHRIKINDYEFEKVFTDTELEEKLYKLKEIFSQKKKSELNYAEISSALLDFSLCLIKKHSKKREHSNEQKDIRFAINYIKGNLDKKLTLEDIASQAGLSKYYFSREFKRVTGMTVTEYLNYYRCKLACMYLSSQMYSVRDVFEMTCFESLTYFSVVFKKYVGMPPSEYLKKVTEKKNRM